MKLLTTSEAGVRLGVSAKRVQQFIAEDRLPAQRFGRVFLIDEKDLKLVENRKPGRPRLKKGSKEKRSRKAPAQRSLKLP
jgi:excisionase family DNA binding protein